MPSAATLVLVAEALAASAGPSYLLGHEMIAVAAPLDVCPAGTRMARHVFYRANQRVPLPRAAAPMPADDRIPPGASNPDLRMEPEPGDRQRMEPERSVEFPVTVSVTLCFRADGVTAQGAQWWTEHRGERIAALASGTVGPGELRVAWQQFSRDGAMHPWLSVVLPRVEIAVQDRASGRVHRHMARLDGNAWVVDGPAPE